MSLASVVVPTWNGLPLLRRCVESLAQQTYRELEVVVVDDGSTDGTVEFLRGESTWLRSVVLPSNRGFAVAMNAGFRAAQGTHLIALNNDAVADPTFVEEMVRSAVSGAGMVAALVALADRDMVDSAGISVLRDGGSRERLRNLSLDDERVLDSREVFGPSAAASLYSRELLDAAGGFDESFEAYYEDVDLAWRARAAGFRCVYNPRARVRHVHSATWGRLSRRKLFLLERNRYWTLWKNYPFRAWPLAGTHHLLASANLVRGSYLDAGARAEVARLGTAALARISGAGSVAAWRRFPELMAARRRVRRSSRTSDAELLRWLEA